MTAMSERHEHDGTCCPGRHPGMRGQPCPPRQPVWCLACQATIVAALRRMPEQLVNLRTLGGGRLAPQPSSSRRPQGRSWTASPSPASDEISAVVAWLSRVETRLREHLSEPPAPSRRALAVSTSVAWLLERSTALLCWDTRSPAAGQLDDTGAAEAEVVGSEALQLSRWLDKAAGRDRLTHRLTAPCPYCEHRALVRLDGRDEVQCRHCGKGWPEAHYQFLIRLVLHELAADREEDSGAVTASADPG